MAEYMRYDDSKALDERGRIDVVDAGASVGGGGGLVVREREDNSTGTVYLDIEAEKLWTAVHNGIVAIEKIEGGSGEEEGGGGGATNRAIGGGTGVLKGTLGNEETIMIDAIVSARKAELDEIVSYMFISMQNNTYTAGSATDKPSYSDGGGGEE